MFILSDSLRFANSNSLNIEAQGRQQINHYILLEILNINLSAIIFYLVSKCFIYFSFENFLFHILVRVPF